MDVLEAIRTRRSIRRFTEQPLEKAVLTQLLEAARWAPSGGNQQPWRFVVVTQPMLRELIRKVSPGAMFQASAYIVICFRPEQRAAKTWAETACMCECYIPAQNIALAAHAIGLGSCIIRSFSQAALREILGIVREVIPVLLVALGYPAEMPKVPPRRCLADLAYQDRYGERWQA